MIPGYKQTEVGVIPEDWDANPLGTLIKLQGGYSFRSENFSDIGTPVIRISDIQGGRVRIDNAICHPPFKIAADFVIREGDFLVAMSGATTGKVGVFDSSMPAFQNQRVGRFVVRDSTRTSKQFVGQMVRSNQFVAGLSLLLEQGAQPNISGRQIESLLFPVPPTLPEQRAIATALSDVDGLLGGLDRLIAKKRDLKQAAMQQLLTGQTRLPGFHDEWEVKRLGDVATIKDGTHQTPKYVPFGIPFFSVEHVTSGDFKNTKFISEEEHQFLTRSFKIEKGDILMTRIGSIGDCKLIDWDVDASFYVSLALLKIRPSYSASYIAHYSKSAAFQKEVELHSLQSAIPKKINLGPISNVKIELPPTIPEQTAIAEVLTEMDSELALLEQRREKTRVLKQAMMQELLTGRTRLL